MTVRERSKRASCRERYLDGLSKYLGKWLRCEWQAWTLTGHAWNELTIVFQEPQCLRDCQTTWIRVVYTVKGNKVNATSLVIKSKSSVSWGRAQRSSGGPWPQMEHFQSRLARCFQLSSESQNAIRRSRPDCVWLSETLKLRSRKLHTTCPVRGIQVMKKSEVHNHYMTSNSWHWVCKARSIRNPRATQPGSGSLLSDSGSNVLNAPPF